MRHSRVINIVDKGVKDWKWETILSKAGRKTRRRLRAENGMEGSPCCRGKEGEAQDESVDIN